MVEYYCWRGNYGNFRDLRESEIMLMYIEMHGACNIFLKSLEEHVDSCIGLNACSRRLFLGFTKEESLM
uniref:Ovule protein n=1 Tax=Syphacia muris TaxID=451379 RepID=A0A0N5ASB6_9BILA